MPGIAEVGVDGGAGNTVVIDLYLHVPELGDLVPAHAAQYIEFFIPAVVDAGGDGLRHGDAQVQVDLGITQGLAQRVAPGHLWVVLEIQVGFGEVANADAGVLPGLDHDAEITLHRVVDVRYPRFAVGPFSRVPRCQRILAQLVGQVAHGQGRTGADTEPVVHPVGHRGLQLRRQQRNVDGTRATDPISGPVDRQAEVIMEADAHGPAVVQGPYIGEGTCRHNALVDTPATTRRGIEIIGLETAVDVDAHTARQHCRVIE